MKNSQKTTIADFVKSIDDQLNGREIELDLKLNSIQEDKDKLAKEKADFDLTVESFNKEKAVFEASRVDVDAKYAKIRSDIKLNEDLSAQALEAKRLEKQVKDVAENLALIEIKLKEVEKRELALGVKERNYKEELKKEFASNLFKA